MKFEWKDIDKKSEGYTQRAEILGGWLVRCFCSDSEHFALTFIPDPEHNWKIE